MTVKMAGGGRRRWQAAWLVAAAIRGSGGVGVDASAAHAAQHEAASSKSGTVDSSSSSSSRTLLPWAIAPLPLGTVRAGGWLRGELQAMADGLPGHELDMYRFVQDSRWLYPPGSGAGSDYSGLNEGLPYWFNGIVPLAYALGDARLQGQAGQVAEQVLALRAADGWIGPEVGGARNLWGRMPFLMGLVQLAEAEPAAEQDVVDALRTFLDLAHGMLLDGGQGYSDCPGMGTNDCSWGQARSHELMSVIQWLLETHPSSEQDPTLWETMDLLYTMNQYKWDEWYQPTVYEAVIQQPTPDNRDFPFLHGVNVGQGLKASAVVRRFTHNPSLLESSWRAVEWTFRDHGAPSGTILADEIERDLASWAGSELCTAVETMYSLSYLYHALGSNSLADRAELAAFSAMPVMMTNDMWAHQYMDQPNGPWAANQINQPTLYTTASGASTMFGLEPMYPCCTVNHIQGYPKFVVGSWGRGNSALVHALLGPSLVNTTVNGGRVTIDCQTDYPFGDVLTYSVQAERPFDLFLRVPGWAWAAGEQQQSYASTVALSAPATNTRANSTVSPDAETGLHRVHLPAGISTVIYTLHQPLRIEQRRNGTAVSVYVGNVLYSLDLSPSETSTLPHPYTDPAGPGTLDYNATWPQVRDYYFSATTPWNVAIDPATINVHRVQSNGIYLERAYGDQGNQNYLTVLGCEVEWPLIQGVAPDVPPADPKCLSPGREFRMVPYGGAKAHMSELPVIDFAAGAGTGETDLRKGMEGAGEPPAEVSDL